MIQSLLLENFESHKKTILEFPPGLTVFVGETDRGKSGSFRAYQWVVENSPGGEWMLPLYWKGDTKVTAVFTDPDAVVQRIRSKSKNLYRLNNNEPVNAGTSVPADIASAINVDTVNFQSQIDRAFLMFETAGERGRILNKIAGLDKIEFTLSNAKSDVLKLNKAWESEKQKIKEKKEELLQYEDIEERESKIARLDMLFGMQKTAKNRARLLEKVLNDISDINKRIDKISPILNAGTILKELQGMVAVKDSRQLRKIKLQKLLESSIEIQRKEQLESFNGFDERLQIINDKKENLASHQQRLSKLKRMLNRINVVSKNILEIEKEIKNLQSKIPNICTECGREL